MIRKYHLLKQVYAKNGYEAALDLLEIDQSTTPEQEIIQTNFYCYLVIQKNYRIEESVKILNDCLTKKECRGPIKALTKYHIAQSQFQNNIEKCKEICEEIVNQFLGEFHGLRIRFDRNEKDDENLFSLQHIIYYCFLLLAFACNKENNFEKSQSFIKASKNLMKQMEPFQPNQSKDKCCVGNTHMVKDRWQSEHPSD